MKKLLTAVAVLGVATLAFGQGQVAFLNTSATLVSTNGNKANPSGPLAPTGITGTAVGANGYVYGLFAAPVGTTDPSAAAWSFVSYGTNLASAGRFNGGSGTALSPVVPGYASGTSVNVLVRGWSANLGYAGIGNSSPAVWNAVAGYVEKPDTAAALVGDAGGFWYGQSGIGTVITGGGGNPIPTIFGATAGLISSGFTLNFVPVPEPSTMALAGLGAAALMIFRRRK